MPRGAPSSAVTGRGAGKYWGERKFPFVLPNLHQYFLYIALVYIVILWYDALKAFWFDGHFGIGVGSLVMLTNMILLSGYTFSCHSLRHLVGRKLDCLSCEVAGGACHQAWKGLGFLNERHMLFVWLCLFFVALCDLYITLVARGVITDLRIL